MSVKWRVRVNGSGKTEIKEFSARKAIIHHCNECFGFGSSQEVRGCTDKLCALYPFRLPGKEGLGEEIDV